MWYINFVENDVFETEGGVYGSSWPALKSKYAAQKAKKYPGRGVLEASGYMRTHWTLYTSSPQSSLDKTIVDRILELLKNAQGFTFFKKFYGGRIGLP